MVSKPLTCAVHIDGMPTFSIDVPSAPGVGDEFHLSLPNPGIEGDFRVVRIEKIQEPDATGGPDLHLYCEQK